MKKLTIVKIGGNVIDDEIELNKFLRSFAKIKTPKLLVHGGGKLATTLSTKLGIETKMIEGRRITDAETLKIATMVYAGLVNKTIAAKLNAHGTKAIGLSGSDNSLIPSVKRKKDVVDYGFVGDVVESKINCKFLLSLFENGITPVIAPITSTAKGQLLNTNADTIASCLASALSKHYKVNSIYCFEKKGVLNNNKVIKELNKRTFEELKAKEIVSHGMIPKLENALRSINNGVQNVIIGHSSQLLKLIKQDAGTTVTK